MSFDSEVFGEEKVYLSFQKAQAGHAYLMADVRFPVTLSKRIPGHCLKKASF